MGGTSCKGKCHIENGRLAKNYTIRPLVGNTRKEDRNKKQQSLKCGVCSIRIYDYPGTNCPCCNNLLRTSTRYKPPFKIHKLEDNKRKLKLNQVITLEDGHTVEIVKVVLIPELPVIHSPVLIIAEEGKTLGHRK